MSNAANQLVILFEINGLSPEQIAELEGLELGAVKAILYANSSKYRAANKSEVKNDLTDDDEELALSVIRRVAQFSEDDTTALKAAMFIRNDKKGRLDAKKGFKKLNINVNILNEHFAAAARAIGSKVNPQSQQPITDV